MVKIDADKAIELIGKAIEMRGEDYIDPNSDPDAPLGCVYAEFTWERRENEGIPRRAGFIKPGCIVGTALYHGGVSVDDLRLISGCGGIDSVQDEILSGGIRDTYGSDRIEIDLEMTHGAVAVFAMAQAVQDDNKTWGEAYHHALQTRDELEDTDAT